MAAVPELRTAIAKRSREPQPDLAVPPPPGVARVVANATALRSEGF